MKLELVESIIWPILFLPLIGALLAYLAGQVNKSFSGWAATLAAFLSFFVVILRFIELRPGEILEESVFEWFRVFDLHVAWMLRFDQLTAVMCLVITGVGSLIHLYSIAYMAGDEGRPRFFAYLNLFIFSMLLLVLGGNLPLLFVGWEGVGLCSYLLIGFWYKNLAFAAAGRKAFIVNRIGDAGFLAGIFLLYSKFGTVDFLDIGNAVSNQPELLTFYTTVALCLFIGACGKSAQIPLFVWLPDAMAGPTPVSALIHAATMVTAGVYLLARMSFLFALAPAALAVVGIVAVFTALIAASIALTQNDIKKVLAYSTVSQLGFMFMACSAGAYAIAIFHLVTHAFFKGCLFLGAGSVIQGSHHEQDLRRLGGLWRSMPVTALTFAISGLAIAGIAPLAGYYSKHAILAALGATLNPYLSLYADALVWAASLAAFFTAFYMARLFALTFLGNYKGEYAAHESPWQITSVLIVLALLSLAGGYVLNGVYPLEAYLGPVLPKFQLEHETGLLVLLRHSLVGVLGVLSGLYFYARPSELPGMFYARLGVLSRLSSGKFFIDEVYNLLLVKPLQAFSAVCAGIIDQGVIDWAVNGLASLIDLGGEHARKIQTGQLRDYAWCMSVAALVLVGFLVMR